MKRYIYIPSFDTGVAQRAGHLNVKLKDGTPWRFWDKEFPERWKHYAYLVTAGHNYKKFDYAAKYEFSDNMLIFGDSGGFQIASGVIDWNPGYVDTIFKWLENNSKVAINLDIPPRMRYEGKFDECLDISSKNFEYFEKNQTGKVDFLNVLHGSTYDAYKVWYNRVKGYEFQGWALGGAIGRLNSLMEAMIVLLEGKELANPRCKYLHVLGASSVADFLILAQIQKSLYEAGSQVTITTDSSSPSRSTAFGIYYTGFDLKKLAFQYLTLPRKKAGQVFHIDRLPEAYDIDKQINESYSLQEFLEFKTEHYAWMVIHNLMVFLDCHNQCIDYVYSDYGLLQQMCSPDMYKLLKCIDDVIKSDNPYLIYNRYKVVFERMSRILSNNNSTDEKHDFF